ncbi:MAG TPA: hypothetical protein P5038_20185, partial [Candidatus Paceibacterota bacterium]|nr:hypothetical protein [Candidatus Paceibacterota bacterium]
LGLYRARAKKKASGETSFLESRLQPDSFFGASGGQRIDTREAPNSSSSSSPSSMSYSLSQLDAIGDVVGELAEARDAGFLNCGFAAKAPADAWLPPAQTLAGQRKRFRHELASALAVLMAGGDQIPDDVRDLVAYLVAAHHGKVRLSIRSLPEETPPPDGRRFARGIWDQDDLPATDLGGGVLAPAVKLSLEPMELGLCEQPPFQGQPSWTERMLRLRDTLGPCHLAWLEALLRAADIRVSAGLTPPGGAGTPGGLAGAVEPTDIAGSRTTTPALSSQERSLVAELVEDGLRIQDQFRPEPLYKQSGKHPGTRTTTPEVRDAFRTDGNQQGEST